MEPDSPSTAIGPRQYWCFLSYRHSDNKRPGRQWASWLHHALETYEIPSDLVGKTNDRGDTIPERIYPVFRDEEELSADAQLTKPIEQALAHSRYLVVLCSPDAVESRFVEDEIIRFKTLRPENRERLLAAIIAGDPTSRVAAGAELPYPGRQCFPRPLRYEVAPDGALTEQPTEPIAADFRLPDGGEGFTSAEAYRAHLGKAGSSMRVVEYQQRLELMKLKIVAGILGIPLGLLTARDQAYQIEKERQRAQTLRRWLAAVAVLTVLALAAGGFAWYQRGIARYERSQAQVSEGKAVANARRALEELKEASRSDVASAQARLAEGKWQEAVAYLGRAIRYDPENRNAQDALWLALRYGKRDAGAMPTATFTHAQEIRGACISPDAKRVATASNDHTVRLWNIVGTPLAPPIQHDGVVNGVAFSPDGSRVLSWSDDHTARLWDAHSGQPVGSALQHEEAVAAACFNPDGTSVVTASNDGTARVWETKSGQPLTPPLAHAHVVRTANFSPDGRFIVTASEDRTARVWDVHTGEPVGHPCQHEAAVTDARFSPDGAWIVTACEDHEAQIWDAHTGQRSGPPLVHAAVVFTAEFSPDGTRIVTASIDSTARLWDAATAHPIGVPLRHQAGVLTARFSADGARVLTTSYDNTARLWDAATGQPLGSPLQHADTVLSACFGADGAQILTASADHTACLWDARTSLPLGVPFPHPTLAEMAPNRSEDRFETFVAQWSPDGSVLATAADDGIVRLWPAEADAILHSVKSGGVFVRHGAAINSICFSPDGTQLLTAGDDSLARLWDFRTRQLIGAPLAHGAFINAASFSRDGGRMVTASADFTARVWDAKTGRPLTPPLAHPVPALDESETKFGVFSACFSPDGTRVLTAGQDGTARLWNAASGQPLLPPLQHAKAVRRAIFSPDGSLILTASEDNTARLWNANSGQPIGESFRHNDFVVSVAFSPDGTRFVTTSNDQTARLWNTQTHRPIGPPMRHDGWVLAACFSPDGTRVVTASNDHTARLWDAGTAQPLGPPLRHSGWVLQARFNAEGTRILTTGTDHTARLWDLRTGPFLPSALADELTDFFSGARLDLILGSLQPVPATVRTALWKKLAPSMNDFADWRFTISQLAQRDPISTLVSPRTPVSVREASTRLLWTLHEDLPAEVLAMDPTNPLLPFGLALFESTPQSDEHPAAQNFPRTAWLCAHGPASSHADLLLAARLVAKVAKVLPTQKAVALSLLDRAVAHTPEDEDTKQLRAELSK